MFVLCRMCAETSHQGNCTHSSDDRSLTGTWVSVELQKAAEVGYRMITIYEVWQYDDSTVYDPITDSGGLFAQCTNTFMKIKMEASGYPSWCITEDEKGFIERVTRELHPTTLCITQGGV